MKTDFTHADQWDKNTLNKQEAQNNSNIFIADTININENDKVLDAGCGIGGPSIFIAETYKCDIIGITLSKVQLEIAKKNARKSSQVQKIHFYKQDYTKTEFDDESFTKIFAIESVCHAEKKSDFIKEAYRLLSGDGQLIVLDAFLIKQELDEKDKMHLQRCLDGWCLPNLSHVDNFRSDLLDAGFEDIELINLTTRVQKSINGLFVDGLLAFPITWLLSKLGIIQKNVHNSILTLFSQRYLIKRKVGIYGGFAARKISKFH
ncbi:MAG: SAM-dependent methyltransferase [Candidatus Kariarchaeaceae archaeon]|jgi:cyclopropane fatty-acyl-phospholipid synthase-like methyltransferase